MAMKLALALLACLLGVALGAPCQDEYGSSATCIDQDACKTSGNIPYGLVSGKCPGAANIKCCTNFLMTNAFKAYNPASAPWQKTALETLQNRLIYFAEFRRFSCMYRNKPYDAANPTFCGGEDGMDIIKMVNVATYYDENAQHQVDALNYLQGVLQGAALINDYLKFVQGFRNLVGGAPGGSFLPNPPSTANSQGACTSPFNGFKGICIPLSQCTGATFNGLCPGSSKCCATETRAANPLAQHVSFASFRSLMEGISETRAAALWPYFNEAVDQILRDNPSSYTKCHRIAAMVAQVGHESNGLLYFEELASGSAYNGRTDLGNVQANDGPRFKGRGPIQLTGRSNYRNAGASLNMDFEARPEQVCFPSAGFKATTWFWTRNNLNRYCTGSYTDFTALSRAINGGYNGIDDRRSRWARAKSLLGCPAASSETETSYVLEEAGLSANSNVTNPELSQELCPAKASSGAMTTVAVVVPITLVLLLVILGLTVYIVKKNRAGGRV